MNKEKNLYRLTIPISNYYGEEVFFQNYYFEGKKSPTKEEVLQTLLDQDKKYSEDPEYFGAEIEAAEMVASIPDCDFPQLYGSLIMTNTFVNHPKFGLQPVALSKITPFQLVQLEQMKVAEPSVSTSLGELIRQKLREKKSI